MLRSARPVFGALLLLLLPVAAHAIDCGKARSAVERGICSDPHLTQLDQELGQYYADALDATQGATRQTLRNQQRRWVAERDRNCRSGAAACLLPLYEARRDALKALTARVSSGNPMLSDVTAVALLGTWTVDGYLPASNPALAVDDSTKPPELPASGTTLTGRPGELCDASGACRTFGLDRQSLQATMDGDTVAATLHLSPDTPFYVAYLSGKAVFGLIPLPDGSLLAQFNVCNAGQTICGAAWQKWLPTGPEATVRVFPP